MRPIGADRMIDYTREDFADGRTRYDVILDIAGNRSLSHLRRALAPEGTLVIVGGEGGGKWLGGIDRQLRASLLSPFVRQKLGTWISKERQEDLEELRQFIEAGKVTPVVDRTFPLSEAREAIRYLREGHAHGKVVLTVLGLRRRTRVTPRNLHGKEGGRRFESVRGLHERPANGLFLSRRACDLAASLTDLSPRPVPSDARSPGLALTDASEATEHLDEEVGPQGLARSTSTNELHSLVRLILGTGSELSGRFKTCRGGDRRWFEFVRGLEVAAKRLLLLSYLMEKEHLHKASPRHLVTGGGAQDAYKLELSAPSLKLRAVAVRQW